MEAHPESHASVYSHYNHSDSRKYFRWTARESFRFMYDRPWQEVNNFYSNMVNGHSSLFDLFSDELGERSLIHDTARSQVVTSPIQFEDVSNEGKSGRWERVTFKVVLSYHGISFDGWQKQPGLSTVQSLIESSLGKFVDDRKAQLLKDKHKPLEGCAVVAGRTDKGVSALGQVCSFYTWRKDVKPHDIEDAINSAAPGKIRVTFVSKVSRVFHPNFSAKWRRYLYIFPFSGGEYREQNFETQENAEDFSYCENCYDLRNECHEVINEENVEHAVVLNKDELGEARKPMWFSVCRVNRLLQQLEGKLLSYKVFARDTKASRNIGPATECFVYHARAKEAKLPSSDQGEGRKVMCVELVANRFLRKMVRVLVATSIREAAAGAEEDVLLKLMDATSRRATAPPAPPDGLCLVDVGYTELDPRSCIIP